MNKKINVIFLTYDLKWWLDPFPRRNLGISHKIASKWSFGWEKRMSSSTRTHSLPATERPKLWGPWVPQARWSPPSENTRFCQQYQGPSSQNPGELVPQYRVIAKGYQSHPELRALQTERWTSQYITQNHVTPKTRGLKAWGNNSIN